MRIGSVDNNRNITKVGHSNRNQSKDVVGGKKPVQNQTSVQRQKQGQAAASSDYPGMVKGQNHPSQSFDPTKYSNMEALKAVLNQRSAQVSNSASNPQRNASNGLSMQQYNESKSKSFQTDAFPNNSKSNSFTTGQGGRGLSTV